MLPIPQEWGIERMGILGRIRGREVFGRSQFFEYQSELQAWIRLYKTPAYHSIYKKSFDQAKRYLQYMKANRIKYQPFSCFHNE
jgi:hypothetical protein